MKYLSLILVCYAVKCDNVGNNYFVVNMPEDIQQDLKDFKKPFQVYWNVPTMQCASKKVPFKNLYEKFGIIQNDNDRFLGNKIVTIYYEEDFPLILKNKTTGTNILINGGVPQEGNLENHLIAFENDLNKKIPDPYFDGIAIIDFESWRPVFVQNFGALTPHKQLSIKIEKDIHNWWPKMWIEKEATLRFEAAARKFMQTTLFMAKEKRPNALWGYYGFPYCFNMRGRDMAEKCAKDTDKENDSIYWLWAESTALFPSLYSSVSLTSSQLSSLIKGRIKEASRVRGRDIPIFPYFWFRYRDAGFMTEKDLDVALTTLYQSHASGFILWGSSSDVNTVDKCNKLLKYVETVLGPKIAKYTKHTKKNNDHLENKVIYSKEPSTVYNEFSNSRSTQSLNTNNMFSTETSTDYNTYTKTDESSQTLNNEDISSTESTIEYNEYTKSDTQTINNFDLTLSLLDSSTNSEYVHINLSLPTLNNNEILTTESAIAYDKNTYIDENLQSSNKYDLFSLSSETSTPQTQNNDDISLAKFSTENYVDTKNNDNVIFSPESSTFEYKNGDNSTTDNSDRDESLQTLNYDSSNEETTTVYNEYSNTEENVQNLNKDNVISTSAFDYENGDNSTTSSYNNENSLAKMSTFDNSDRDESLQTLNYDSSNEETTTVYNEYSDTEENVQNLNKDNVISTSAFDYENGDNSTTSSYINENSFAKMSTFDNSDRDESLQTLNYDSSNEETTTVHNEYSNTEENVQNLNKDSVISISAFDYEKGDNSTKSSYNNENSLAKMSTFDNSDRDENLQTSNYDSSNEETTTVYNEYSNTEENVQNLNKDNVISTSAFDYENGDNSTTSSYNNENSLAKMSTFDNSDRDENLQTSNYDSSNEETTTVYNEYSNTEENVQNLNKDSVISTSAFDYENGDNSTTSSYNNNENSFAKMSTFDNSNRDESLQTLNYDTSNEETTIVYNEYSNTEENEQSLNKDHIILISESSTFDYENSNHSKTTLNNNEISITKLSIIHNSNKHENSQTLNYNKSNKEKKIYNEYYSDTEENLQALNNNDIISSTKSTIIYDENSELRTKTFNNDEISSTDTLFLYSNFKNTGQHKKTLNNKEIFSKGTSTINDDFVTENLNNVKYKKNTLPASHEIFYTNKNQNVLNYDETRTESNEFKSTGNVILKSDTLLNSSEYPFDYLIEVDNSKTIETFKQSEYKDNKNIDEDYLINVGSFENKPNLKETNPNSKLETAYDTTQADNSYETVTKGENFGKTRNDPVVTYVKKNQNSTSTKLESFHDIGVLNSGDDGSDYIIKVDNFTNIQTYNQSDHRNNTNADNDYSVIVTDFNNNKYKDDLDNNLNLDLYSTTQTESDYVSSTKFKDLDPVVGYINKTEDNIKIQDPILAEDESLINIKHPNSEEDTSDNLIKLENISNKETDKQYEYTDSTIADKDYIIIIKNLNN